MVFNVVLSLGVQNDSEKAIANLGYYQVEFLRPVYSGDIVRAFTKVLERKDRGPEKPGITRIRTVGINQRDEVVLSLDPAIVSSRRVWSFDLFLFQQPNGPDGNERMPRWSIRWPGSDEEQKGEIPSLAQFFGAESFDLTVVDQANLTDDRWLDVSLLHSVKLRGSSQSPLADSFDFDWLFGTVSGDEALPNALAPVRLNHLPEAQARLIGQSDPLDIQFK